ncbi:unnamed protein product [Symbiodinium sp. CCMP2592]|nr:unnamed protein product [Symbiodinium sp. CCMP2592]
MKPSSKQKAEANAASAQSSEKLGNHDNKDPDDRPVAVKRELPEEDDEQGESSEHEVSNMKRRVMEILGKDKIQSSSKVQAKSHARSPSRKIQRSASDASTLVLGSRRDEDCSISSESSVEDDK